MFCKTFNTKLLPLFIIILLAPYSSTALSSESLKQRFDNLSQELEALKQALQTCGEACETAVPAQIEKTAEAEPPPQRSLLVLPEKSAEIDLTFSYIQSSSTFIAIDGFSILPVFVVGEITSESHRKEALVSGLSLSYGLGNTYQFNLTVPYRSQTTHSINSKQEEKSFRAKGIGDIELGLSKQLDKLPWHSDFDYLASVTWKTTSGQASPDLSAELTNGTGYRGMRVGLTAIKSLPPTVLILNASYSHNYSRTLSINDIDTKIEPGDSLNFGVSMSLALNRSISVNYGLEQQFTEKTVIGGYKNPGTSLTFGNFVIGCSYRLSSGNWLNVSMVMGLSREAPDYQFSVKLPVLRF